MPLPAPHLWHAPAAWQAIDFLSDLHLSIATPATAAALQAHLAATPADAVVLLGDVVDAWVGDDALDHDAFARDLATALRLASQRCPLYLMRGNRDFLFGEAFAQAAGCTLLPDPTQLFAFGHTLLLSHGDALCLADTAYQRWRALSRSPAWQAQFLAQPYPVRADQAAAMRMASREHQAGVPSEEWSDVDETAASHWLAQTGASVLLHGHTHRPGRHRLSCGERWVLSDWDGDTTPPRGDVLRLSPDGLQRLPAPCSD